jgi:hypothetical protein
MRNKHKKIKPHFFIDTLIGCTPPLPFHPATQKEGRLRERERKREGR